MKTFTSDETGAVTVDWVVLTAGLVGLGIAAMAVVSTGVQDSANDTRSQLDGQIIYSAFGLKTDSFSNGIGNWSGANARNLVGFGDVMHIPHSSNLETVSQTFDIPEGTEDALFTFDVLALDSLDHNTEDGLKLYVDGQVVATGVSGAGNVGIDWTYEDVAGVTVTTQETSSGTNLGHKGWNDDTYAVSISVDNPNDTVAIGFGANAA